MIQVFCQERNNLLYIIPKGEKKNPCKTSELILDNEFPK